MFVDAPDDVLNTRSGIRDGTVKQASVAVQRAEDRTHSRSCRHVLQNIDLTRSVEELLGWWRQGYDSNDE